MVREFTDVFLEELSGLLSTRQVDFAIELQTRIALISNASYRTTLREFNELKDQL